MTKTILAAVLVVFTASNSFAALNRSLESAEHIYDRCGVALSNPNAIVASANAPCSEVRLQAMMAPVEQPATRE